MHQREKVVRTIKGEEKIVDFVFGSGILTANPPEVKEVNGGYKVMRAFGFSLKFSNGKDKKPSYYALELWGNNAEHMARLGFEGQLIEVAGRVTTSTYNNKDGVEKTLETLTVERFTCLDRKDQANVSDEKVENSTTPETTSVEEEKTVDEAPVTGTQELPSGIEEVVEEKDEFDDIPF
jgi:single-strand DNA-binding protein